MAVDARKPPIDKACGEGLLPEAVASLRRIGVPLDSSFAYPFAGIQFSDRDSTASAKISQGQGFGLRRTLLQRLLIDRAEEVGVVFQWGEPVTGFEPGGVRAQGRFFGCRWLVGADGQKSAVRKWAGLSPRRPFRSRFGFRRHYSITPWTKFVEVHWGERCQIIITPTGAQEICISLMTSDPQHRVDRVLDQFPEVAKRLRGVPPASTEIGAITALGRARAVTRGNVALVGDASCTVDGVSGQGLSLAFQEAILLADAFTREDLGYYETAHRRITKMPMRIARLMLLMNRSSWLRRKTLRLFANNPHLFSKMIAIHMGDCAAEALNASAILDLGWQVIRA